MPLTIEYINVQEVSPGVLAKIFLERSFSVVIEKDLLRQGIITKHEMLHYLAHIIGGNFEDNYNHTHPFFDACAGVIHP